MKNLSKIDRFYLILFGVLALLAIFVGTTLRGILTQWNRANDIKDTDLVSAEIRVNRGTLDQAYEYINNKKGVVLDLKE